MVRSVCRFCETLARFSQRLLGKRTYSTKSRGRPIIHIPPGSNIYAFGAPSRSRTPLIREVDWTVHEGEAWAVISGTGGGGKGTVFKTLLGHTRVAPPTLETQGRWAENGGLYPFLSASSVDPYSRISHVSFRQRSGAQSGVFFDYTARYGAIREAEDRVTLRETLPATDDRLAQEKHALFERLTREMNLTPLLDLPILTLSNGQTRRARVVKAILNQPELLLLDEPLTGLDPPSRKSLNEILRQLHRDSSPRIIVGLRKGEEIPTWITHVLEIQEGSAIQRRHDHSNKKFYTPRQQSGQATQQKASSTKGSILVDMKDVNVAYGDRQILKNINWQIRQGERWHLQGENGSFFIVNPTQPSTNNPIFRPIPGSGKTTLLALLTGDHPQSYTQLHLHLPAFSISTSSPPSQQSLSIAPTLRPRKNTPTAHLRRLIGVVSPEMFDAFPRRHPGMSVWEAVTTGFDGGFVPRTRSASPEARRKSGVGWVDVSDEELELEAQGLDGAEKEKKREETREWRVKRCWEVLDSLGPAAWAPSTAGSVSSSPSEQTQTFATLAFSSLSPGEQRLVLLMRALVGRPPMVLLDEAWSGMDDAMIAATRRYLRGQVSGGCGGRMVGVDDRQAVVVITHWEEEVPWTGDEVRRFKLSP